jgi:hypothetical protein
MINKIQQDIEEIQFILDEISKFSNMSTQDLLDCSDLWLYHEYNDFVNGEKVNLIYGKNASKALYNISKRPGLFHSKLVTDILGCALLFLPDPLCANLRLLKYK